VQSTVRTSATVGGIDVPAVPTGLFIGGIGRELGWAGIEASTEEKTVTITL
jgi:hypothetical protein